MQSASGTEMITPYDLKRRLQWLMLFRVIIASFFLGLAAVTHLKQSDTFLAPYLVNIYGLTACVYVCSLAYVFVMPFIKRHIAFAHMQVCADMVLVTALLYITGGRDSIFSFMYSIVIIAAGILLYRGGGLLAASAASLCYCSLVVLQEAHLISPPQYEVYLGPAYSRSPLFFPLAVNITAFYLVALLSSFVAEQAKKSRIQLQQKQLDFENLAVLNENIIQSMSDGLVTLNNDQKIITFNRAAQRITGFSRDQVFMKHAHEVFSDIPLSEQVQPPSETNRNQVRRIERAFARPDGTELWVGISFSVLRDKNKEQTGYILVFQDLTEYKQMQDNARRLERLASLGRLAAGIAHEVRNPLASISGSVQVLQKNVSLSDVDKRLMDIIVKESGHLSALISDFTQYARPAASEKKPLNVRELVRDVASVFKNSTECSSALSVVESAEDDVYITGHYYQMRQVLWNLMLNAAQAIGAGAEGTIRLSSRRAGEAPPDIAPPRNGTPADPPHPWAVIEVQDSGCGMHEQEMEKIFDPFFTTRDEGIGLGLSIVQRIIEEHEGHISVTSRKGSGTTFRVVLPALSA